MSTPLLATKLNIPELRPDLMPRPHLLDMLNEGLNRKLTLVAAPAGYGKTTLVSQWARQIDASVAWISLDKNDNDLARFLAYFFAALKTAIPEFPLGGLPAGPAQRPPATEQLLAPLLNELMSLESALVVVLDDFHLIDLDPIHRTLTFLLDYCPQPVHLLIATRVDPPMPVARLRAKGELLELREADLRFTPEELKEFLTQLMGLKLSTDQINKLASRTEGWVTGLQLAAISMRGREDVAGFIEAFSGSHEYIVDYLTDEVLIALSEDLQSFLLQTSILDRLTGPLCEAVTGQDGGQATLEQLREAHLFVMPLDDQRTWYRYHRLFADHLQKRLREGQPHLVAGLHRTASRWFEQNGLFAEAIEHALGAQDFERAAALIDQIAEQTIIRSEFVLFLRWAEALPEPVVKARPMLGIAQAMSLLMTGRPVSEVESVVNSLVCETDAHQGGKSVVQATIAVVTGHLSEAYDLAQEAVNRLPIEEHSLREVAHWIIVYSGALESKPSEGIRDLEKVIQHSEVSGNVMLATAASHEIARLHTFQGQLRRAKKTFEQALDLARDDLGKPLPIAGEGLVGLGDLLREQNYLEQAEQTLLKGIALSSRGRSATLYRGFLSLAKLRLAKGEQYGAIDNIREAKKQAAFKFDQLIVAAAEASARLGLGDIEPAEQWLSERGWGDRTSTPLESDNAIDRHMRKYEHLLQVRLLLARDQTEQALASLKALQRQMELQERIDIIIEIEILKALGYQTQDNLTEALAALETALSLASPGGYVRIFVDQGEPMRQLLLEAAARGTKPAYCGQLLAAYAAHKSDETGPAHPAQTDMAEPLSARELQVLRLLTSALTSTEIGHELFISANTVRFHIKNIYSKLDVHRRSEAVARAKALGLF